MKITNSRSLTFVNYRLRPDFLLISLPKSVPVPKNARYRDVFQDRNNNAVKIILHMPTKKRLDPYRL